MNDLPLFCVGCESDVEFVANSGSARHNVQVTTRGWVEGASVDGSAHLMRGLGGHISKREAV